VKIKKEGANGLPFFNAMNKQDIFNFNKFHGPIVKINKHLFKFLLIFSHYFIGMAAYLPRLRE